MVEVSSRTSKPRLIVRLACGSRSTTRTRRPRSESAWPRLRQVGCLRHAALLVGDGDDGAHREGGERKASSWYAMMTRCVTTLKPILMQLTFVVVRRFPDRWRNCGADRRNIRARSMNSLAHHMTEAL